MSEIETSISFCGLGKIHSSITINMEMLREMVRKSTNLDFLEIVGLVKIHCTLQKDWIEYLIEIPILNPKEDKYLFIAIVNCLFWTKTRNEL